MKIINLFIDLHFLTELNFKNLSDLKNNKDVIILNIILFEQTVSFRFEDKISVGKRVNLFLKTRKKDLNLISQRKISSIYFDNTELNMFVDSEEGSIPRKKIRIRNYPLSFKNRYNLEIKISSIEGRFKDAQEINLEIKNKYTKYGIFDDQYGLTFPACIVNYYREYFYKDEIRVTHDSSIEYYHYNKSFSFKDREVIEIKTSHNFNRNLIDKFFPFSKHRFSKYCEDYLKLNEDNYFLFIILFFNNLYAR